MKIIRNSRNLVSSTISKAPLPAATFFSSRNSLAERPRQQPGQGPTQHYDNARTGQNTQETILTQANVNILEFGKLFTQNLDGQAPAQPLYVPNVFIPSSNSTHNVVYVPTMHDSIYAFDADSNQGSNALPLWQVSFINPTNGITSVPQSDEGCNVGYTEFGIQGTPVIDPTQNAIYFVAMTKENGITYTNCTR